MWLGYGIYSLDGRNMHAGIALGLLLSKHGSLHGQLLTEVLHRTNLRAVLQAKFGLNVNAFLEENSLK